MIKMRVKTDAIILELLGQVRANGNKIHLI